MSKSRIFFYFYFSFILGIFLNSITNFSQLSMLGFLILGIILVSVFWEYKKTVVIGFCLFFLVLGIWRHQVTELRIKNNELSKYNDLAKAITLIGKVVKEPDIRDSNIKLTIEIQDENRSRLIDGNILVTTVRYPEYEYGDELKIVGKLKTPPEFEDFNYKDFLAKNGIYSVIYWPEIELLDKNYQRDPSSLIYKGILFFKNRLRESIYSSLSPPQSSILGSMLLGDKSRMSNDLKEKLNIAGVRHITAVSGMHVVILSSISMFLLIGLGFQRGQAFYFSIALIFLFVVMTGAQSSTIRAGIMGGLFLLAQKVGRKSISSRTIVMTAAIMLAVNPLLLLNDVGFQLSFLAVLGIVYLGPTFKNWLEFMPEQKFINLRSIISMTLAAQIFTLPILVYNFGRISLVAPLTNLLIIPVLYWIMLFGFMFVLAGIIWQFLGWIFSFPCYFLLTYLTKMIDLFSKPWAAKTFDNIHWFWLIISYLVLGFLVWWLKKRERLKFLKY